MNLKEIFNDKKTYVAGLLIAIIVGVFVRTRNLKHLKGKYLLGLDPNIFYKYANIIVEKGKLFALDVMRYVPEGYVLRPTDKFFAYFMAYSYRLISWTGVSQTQFHIIYPVIAAVFCFIFFFLLVKELFNIKIAAIATLFLAVIPAFIYRTGAGFADHEALAFVFMFAALWMFVKAWNNKNTIRSTIISGALTGLMIMTWGGYKFLFAIISFFVLATLIFRSKELTPERIKTYLIWFAISFIFVYWRYSYKRFVFLFQYEFLLILFVALVLFLYTLLNKYNKKYEHVNKGIVSVLIVASAGLIAGTITKTFTIGSIINKLIHPTGANRLALTVSENARTTASSLFINLGFMLTLSVAGLITIIYLLYKNNEKNSSIFAVCFFVFTFIAAMGSHRTIIAFAPAVAMLAAYFVYNVSVYLIENDKKAYAGLLIVFAVFCFAQGCYESNNLNSKSGSNYPGQWETSMEWIKANTSANSVIAHWWDYGYWTQVKGERASVVDGGNAKGWDHQMGRYGLLGRDPNNYMSYYKTHRVTHLLISGEELNKMRAFSTVGSDENFDLKSNVGFFELYDVKEIRNGTRKTYRGGWLLDKDYVWDNLVFYANKDAIVGITLDDDKGEISNVNIMLIKNNIPYYAPLNNICVQGMCMQENKTGFPGTVTLIPSINNNEVESIGGAIFTSEKIQDTLLVKLFIKQEQIPFFKEVYNDKTPFVFYNGRVIAPIRIWEIWYPEFIKEDEKYLEFSKHG